MTGYTKKSKMLDKMTFGAYGKKFENRTAFDWLTRDTAVVDKYIADEYCGFLFSAQGMNDLVKLNISANSDDWYAKVKKELPILVVSGALDPVGEYSKGINTICDKLVETGHTNVTKKLYENDRHEVLNELDKADVYADINNWIEQNIL
jgi:alpha-beta hydrolase superfamily lysophospholipase